MAKEKNRKPDFRAASIVKRNGKDFFIDIGAAWKTESGGYAIRLNALPLGDTIILSAPRAKDEQAEETEAE